jgi:hypothetical protein
LDEIGDHPHLLPAVELNLGGPWRQVLRSSGRFYHPTRFDAVGANHHLFGPTVVHGPHTLQVGIKAAFIDVMGVADIIAHHGLLSAYLAHFRHLTLSVSFL